MAALWAKHLLTLGLAGLEEPRVAKLSNKVGSRQGKHGQPSLITDYTISLDNATFSSGKKSC